MIKLAKQRYIQQRCAARQRNIEWLFDFESWWSMWCQSGKWDQRGRREGQYCMARKGDQGPYSIDNVDIVLVSKNCSDGRLSKPVWNKGKQLSECHKNKLRQVNTGKKHSQTTKDKLSKIGLGRPWSEARRQSYLNSKTQKSI